MVWVICGPCQGTRSERYEHPSAENPAESEQTVQTPWPGLDLDTLENCLCLHIVLIHFGRTVLEVQYHY